MTHIIILDGTLSSLEDGEETNAGLTYRLLSEATQPGQSIYYEQGIQWETWRQVWDVMVGKGMNRQIRRAYGYLASRYRPGDKIYFFGYSRGAFAVRSLAGMIDRVGLLKAGQATERNVDMAYRHYRAGGGSDAARAFRRSLCHDDAMIEMIGAWDTVKALGLRLPLLWMLTEKSHDFHDHHLARCVRSGFHALALQETREVYAPVMWDSDPAWSGRLEQVWFAGTHGDVGGHLGTPNAPRGLSNIPLAWMLTQAEIAGLDLPHGWRQRFPVDVDTPSIGTWGGLGKLFLIRKRRVVGRDPSERLHETAAARGFRLPVGGRRVA